LRACTIVSMLSVGVAFAVSGCGSAAGCRFAAGMEEDPYAREVALNRCYVEEVRQQEYAAQADAQRRHDQETREAADRATRAQPVPPELGGTRAESEALCKRQNGVHGYEPASPRGGTWAVCRVAGRAIYAAYAADGYEDFEVVSTYFEGDDVARWREAAEAKHGAADAVEVRNGFRVWTWTRRVPYLSTTSYDGGVLLTRWFPRESNSEQSVRQQPVREQPVHDERVRGALAAQRSARQAPRSPDLGSTPTESELLCRRQGGTHDTDPSVEGGGALHVCRIGGLAAYAGYISPGEQTFDRVVTYFERLEIDALREAFESKLGAADDVRIVEGYRVWTWLRGDTVRSITTYERGASVTRARLATPAASDDPGEPTVPGITRL